MSFKIGDDVKTTDDLKVMMEEYIALKKGLDLEFSPTPEYMKRSLLFCLSDLSIHTEEERKKETFENFGRLIMFYVRKGGKVRFE